MVVFIMHPKITRRVAVYCSTLGILARGLTVHMDGDMSRNAVKVENSSGTAASHAEVAPDPASRLFAAARECSVSDLRELLLAQGNSGDHKNMINSQDEKGETILMQCMNSSVDYTQRMEFINFLIHDCKSSFDPNLQTKTGDTALHLAAKFNWPQVADIFLKNGAKLNATTRHGCTPLHYAVEKGHLEVMEILLERADIKLNTQNENVPPVLTYAVQAATRTPEEKGLSMVKALTIVDLLLEKRANANIITDVKKESVLTAALQNRDVTDEHTFAIVKLLFLKAKYIDRDHINQEGCSALHLAVSFNWPQMVDFLLKNGADVNVSPFGEGFTPLHSAVRMGHLEVVEILLKNGAKLNATNWHGHTPLHYAVEKGHLEIMDMLLKRGDIKLYIENRRVPPVLTYAVQATTRIPEEKILSMVKALISAAAAVDDKMETINSMWQGDEYEIICRGYLVPKQITALHAAAERALPSVVQYLLDQGADSRIQNHMEANALNWALLSKGRKPQQQKTDTIKMLARASDEKSINAKNIFDFTALQVLLCTPDDEIHDKLTMVKLFVENKAHVANKHWFSFNRVPCPIVLAAEQGRADIVQYLASQGASLKGSSLITRMRWYTPIKKMIRNQEN